MFGSSRPLPLWTEWPWSWPGKVERRGKTSGGRWAWVWIPVPAVSWGRFFSLSSESRFPRLSTRDHRNTPRPLSWVSGAWEMLSQGQLSPWWEGGSQPSPPKASKSHGPGLFLDPDSYSFPPLSISLSIHSNEAGDLDFKFCLEPTGSNAKGPSLQIITGMWYF